MKSTSTLLKELTWDEKTALLIGATPWTTTAVPRLGIPSLFLADGPHGVRRVVQADGLGIPGHPATCFPAASLLAATWNPALIEELGRALGDEAKALRVDVLLGPGVNMKRSPLGGRNFEYYSEDPYLAGAMAAAFITGVQSRGVGTSLKHFAANNQEFQRFTIDAVIDERALREIYLPAFETAVKGARPWTVMGAYNRVNGVRSCENTALLSGLLRGEWGFQGAAVSDWGAVQDRVRSLEAGLDLEMPGPREARRRALVRSVRSGRLSKRAVNQAVARVLELIRKCSAVPKGGEIDARAHHALAKKIAGEGFVLLKNNGLLPLDRPRSLAVIGRSAREPYLQGGGSSHVTTRGADVPLEEIKKLAGAANVSFAWGYPVSPEFDQALIDEAVDQARAAETALLFIALNEYLESESYDRTGLELTAHQTELIRSVCAAQPRTAVILGNGGVVTMGGWIDGAAAVLEAWMTGEAGGAALAETLWGVINPSGKLAETIPLDLADTPAYINFPGENGQVRYGEGLFIGYRYYDFKRAAVQFPFGHGLSYTVFKYSRLRFSSEEFRDRDGLEVSFEVANAGKRAGQETAQVYVRDVAAGLVRPLKELKGFAKIELAPGERKTVALRLDFRAFAFYHPAHGRWITESGEFEILVGASSADIRLRGLVRLVSTLDLPSLLTRESSVRQWVDDGRGRGLLEPILERIKAALIGRGTHGSEDTGMDMMGFILETPLESLLRLWQNALGLDADRTVAELLKKVNAKKKR